MRKFLMAGLAAVCLTSQPAVAQDADGIETLQLEQYLEWEQAGSPQISPDGDTIIYTRRRVDPVNDGFTSELWIMNADGSRHRFLTRGGAVTWSPDGERIAFMRSVDGKPQIFTRWMDAEGAESQVSGWACWPAASSFLPRWHARRPPDRGRGGWGGRQPRGRQS